MWTNKTRLWLAIMCLLIVVLVYLNIRPQVLTATSNVKLPQTINNKVLAVQLKHKNASELEAKLIEYFKSNDIVSGPVIDKIIFVTKDSTLNTETNIHLIVTDKSKDADICRKISTSDVETDLIYFGELSSEANLFYKNCIMQHPTHPCMGSWHTAKNPQDIGKLIGRFTENYGILRIAC